MEAGQAPGSPERRRRTALLLWALLLLGIVMGNAALLLLGHLVELPTRMTVRSGGFFFPAMEASGQLVRNIVLGGVLVAALAWRLLHDADALPRRRPWLRGLPAREFGLACAGIAFLWGLYAAYPPQISFTNFRIVWVDWAVADTKIRYFGQILRDTFYSYPHLLQAGALLLSFLGLQGIGRTLGYRTPAASAFALAFCMSAVFVQFAGVGEDWLVVTAVSLAAMWAYSCRRWGVMVVAVVALGGLRLPASIVVLFAITLVEAARCALVAWDRTRGQWALVAWAAGRILLAWGAVLAGSYFGFLHFSAFGDGDLAAVSSRPAMVPIPMDGFALSRFSGAYITHGFWALPPALLASCLLVLAFAKPLLRTTPGRTALASALAFGGTILMYEAVVDFQFYYNYRYLAMAVPFGLTALLYVLAKFRPGGAVAVVAVLGLLLSHPRSEGRSAGQRELDHALYSCRNVLAPALQGKTVYLASNKKALANGVAYIGGFVGGVNPVYPKKGKRKFRPGELVFATDGPGSGTFARRSGLEEVAQCRGWVVLAPR
jgi:hypothetical protein